jgi:hypothetical protein
MGSHAILIGGVGLAAALIGLLSGFTWGRSNLKAQIADALDKARASKDMREFELLEQLSSKMLEVNQLRARADELPGLQEQLEQLKSQQVRGSAGGRSTAWELGNATQARQQAPERQQKPAPAIESADKTVQNLLKSLEEKLKQPEAVPQAVIQKSAPPPPPARPPVAAQPRAAAQKTPPPPPPAKQPATEPRIAAQQTAPQPPPPPPAKPPAAAPRVAAQRITPPAPPQPSKLPEEKPRTVISQRPSANPPAGRPSPSAKDEWQEFAASLEALTRNKK